MIFNIVGNRRDTAAAAAAAAATTTATAILHSGKYQILASRWPQLAFLLKIVKH